MTEINKGTRIINYIIDLSIISIVYGIVNVVLGYISSNGIFYFVYLAYYFLFELLKGQTIGKMITKTVVVNMDNLKPSFGRVLLRTVLRLNPFDSFSYLFGQEQGGHDLISKTRLKNKT